MVTSILTKETITSITQAIHYQASIFIEIKQITV